MIAEGAAGQPVPAMPTVIPRDSVFAPSVETPQLNAVSPDWTKTVIQAASLNLDFLQEVGARAAQILIATLQQHPVSPAESPEDPSDVPTPSNSG